MLTRLDSLFIKNGSCVVHSLKSSIIGCIPLVWELYHVSSLFDPSSTPSVTSATKLMSISELHCKMGHRNHDDLCRMVKQGMVTGIEVDLDSKPKFCKACIKAKADRKPFPKKSETVYTKYGEKVVSDLWGPARVESLGGKKYYFLFKDLCSCEEKVYFLKAKSDAFTHCKKYEAWTLVQHNAQIKIFRSDCAGELTSKEFNQYLENAGMICYLTVHDSPASNSTIEWENWTHLNNAHAMMIAACLPRFSWAEAVHHNVWLHNCAPMHGLSELKTPHKVATGEKPDLLLLIEWGTTVWVK